MKGQMNLFPEEYIKDSDCTKDTPVVHGKPDTPIYGMGARIKPRVPGRQDTEHFKSIYLDSLLPLEEYDLIAILLSGGKDSIACYYKLLELGVPKDRIEFWHHDIDGGHPSRRMDWRCTQNYVRAFAEAENVPLRLSWRVNGFFGELYRIGMVRAGHWRNHTMQAVQEISGVQSDKGKLHRRHGGETERVRLQTEVSSKDSGLAYKVV